MAKSEVYFEDNTLKVIDNTENIIEAVLLECAAEMVSQTAENTRVDTGQLKGSWRSDVDKKSDGYEAVIGSPLENAIWEEFGKKVLCRIKIGQNRLKFYGKYGIIYP